MPLLESTASDCPQDSFCILIPFHHREDLLLPLLEHIQSFPTIVVDDGTMQSDWNVWGSVHPNLTCIRTGGDSGFTAAVNSGLDRVETLGFRFVLVLNDDAWLNVDDIQTLINWLIQKDLCHQ